MAWTTSGTPHSVYTSPTELQSVQQRGVGTPALRSDINVARSYLTN
jgi:hypothetical protein